MINNLLQPPIKWEQRQRLTLLEATVFWSGEFFTNVLMDGFGISRVQASKDFTLYQSLCPGNIRYDKFLKRYVVDEPFKPGFMTGTAGEFLQVLKVRQDRAGSAVVTLVKNLPEVEVLEPVFRQVNAAVLQAVNQAIVAGREVQVRYQSMSRPEPALHRLCPHALVFDGLRWHVRAFSYTHHEFRDFVLARMLSAELSYSAEIDASEDTAWHEFVGVRIGAHPGLSATQKQAVEFDYGMTAGILEHQVRAALVPYFLRVMRINRDDLTREAMVQQIVLLNRDELEQYWVF
ncbi:WYL domain-containing protein [Methylobacter svalbardensis]|uniref:WYL domain-containing protein n=1 Tax=Methylobacter svalbardensis TaxID=3080016 RepID=UPI0030ED5BAF